MRCPRASASTTRWASGRKTISHNASCRSLVLRERASLDKRSFAHRCAGADELTCSIDLVPDIPEQDAARAPVVVDIGDGALVIRLVPVLDRLEPGVDRADGLVAEVVDVGVEYG